MVVVGLVAGGPDAAGLGPARALVCTVLTGHALAYGLFGTRIGSICAAPGECGIADWTAIMGAVMLVTTTVAFLTAAAVSPLVSAVNAITRRPRPAVIDPRAAVPARYARLVRIAFACPLVAGAVNTAAAAYAHTRATSGGLETGGAQPEIQVPAPGGPVDVPTVCAEVASAARASELASLLDSRRPELGAMAMGATDPVVAALGRELRDGSVPRANSASANTANAARYRWCLYPG